MRAGLSVGFVAKSTTLYENLKRPLSVRVENVMPRYPQAILVSCEVPWDENEDLMEGLFRREVRRTLQVGFNHLYIFGTAGEGYADLPPVMTPTSKLEFL